MIKLEFERKQLISYFNLLNPIAVGAGHEMRMRFSSIFFNETEEGCDILGTNGCLLKIIKYNQKITGYNSISNETCKKISKRLRGSKMKFVNLEIYDRKVICDNDLFYKEKDCAVDYKKVIQSNNGLNKTTLYCDIKKLLDSKKEIIKKVKEKQQTFTIKDYKATITIKDNKLKISNIYRYSCNREYIKIDDLFSMDVKYDGEDFEKEFKLLNLYSFLEGFTENNINISVNRSDIFFSKTQDNIYGLLLLN